MRFTSVTSVVSCLCSAAGSQLEYQLLLARDLEYLTDGDYTKLAAETVEVRKMLAGLSHSLHG